LKKVSRKVTQPGEVTNTVINVPITKRLDEAAIRTFLRFLWRRADLLDSSIALGFQMPPKSYGEGAELSPALRPLV